MKARMPLTEAQIASKARYDAIRHAKNPDRRRACHLRQAYGVDLEWLGEQIVRQHGVCGLCGLPPDRTNWLVIDHCHATGAVRGLLHRQCNAKVIGVFEKHTALIARAPEYLAGKLSDPVVANDNKEAA